MAGKTGTAQTEYWMKDWKENRRYISSFAGYFPAQNPKYSCIVVIHKPSINKGYYGADVTGPVFKRIAQKIYTETPLKDEILDLKVQNPSVEEDYEAYYSVVNQEKSVMPNVIGMPAMDALALLENMGLRVKLNGVGNIKSQSLDKGAKIKRNQLIELKS